MSDLADFPTIEATPAPSAPAASTTAVDLKRVDLQAVALAQFGDWRADVAEAQKNLSTLALDLSIPVRIAEAKSLRQRLINAPIADARATSKALKSKLAQVSKAVGAEEDAAVAAYTAAGTLITPKIEAAEKKIEADRIAREKAEADRLQALRDTVDAQMTAWAMRGQAEGMTAGRLAGGIEQFRGLTLPESVTDVAPYWHTAHASTLAKLEAAHLALASAELAAEQAKVRAEAQRVAGIQARIAEIQAAATGHEKASSVDLIEAGLIVDALDVGEGVYQEFTALAQAAKAATLATLKALTDAALARGAADDAAAEAAAEAARQAQHSQQPGAESPVSQEGVGENPLQSQPAAPFPAGDATAEDEAVDEAVAAADDSTAPGVTQEFTESPDATDRDAPADTSPRGGAMGAGQPDAAGPVGDDGPLETSEADARPWTPSPFYDMPAPAASDPHAEFVTLVMTAFDCKFPSHPKPSQEWWAKVRSAGEALRTQDAS